MLIGLRGLPRLAATAASVNAGTPAGNAIDGAIGQALVQGADAVTDRAVDRPCARGRRRRSACGEAGQAAWQQVPVAPAAPPDIDLEAVVKRMAADGFVKYRDGQGSYYSKPGDATAQYRSRAEVARRFDGAPRRAATVPGEGAAARHMTQARGGALLRGRRRPRRACFPASRRARRCARRGAPGAARVPRPGHGGVVRQCRGSRPKSKAAAASS